MDDGVQLAVRDKSFREHKRRLQRIRPSVDMNTPRNFPKPCSNFVGTFSAEEYLEMTQNNKRLLRRLTNISTTKSKFAKMKGPKRKRSSLNKTRKKQEAARIERENKFLVHRIMNCKPSINHKKIDADWNRHRNIINNRTVSKRKRRSFRPNRLSPISTTESSATSTPMVSARNEYESPYRMHSEALQNLDIRDLQNMSPHSLQRLIAAQSPLTTITERSSINANSYRDRRDLRHLHQSEPMHSGKSFKPNNLIFSPHIKPKSMMRQEMRQDVEDDKEEEDDVFDEILSEWEHDEEWMQKEKKSVHNRKNKRVRKNVNVGLPMI